MAGPAADGGEFMPWEVPGGCSFGPRRRHRRRWGGSVRPHGRSSTAWHQIAQSWSGRGADRAPAGSYHQQADVDGTLVGSVDNHATSWPEPEWGCLPNCARGTYSRVEP